MNQGDIYWYTCRVPDKRRPVLIMTRQSALRYLSSVTVVPITSTVRGIPTEVRLTPDDGVLQECAVNCDNLQTVTKAQLGPFITHLSAEKLQFVRAAIAFALGLDDRE